MPRNRLPPNPTYYLSRQTDRQTDRHTDIQTDRQTITTLVLTTCCLVVTTLTSIRRGEMSAEELAVIEEGERERAEQRT